MSHRLEPGEIKFEFDVGTNLNPQVNGHAHDLTYQIIDKDTCVRIGSVPFRRSSRSSCRQDESRSTIVDVQQPTGTWTATNPVMSHESAETSLRFNASASQANEVRDVDHEIEGDVTISDGHDQLATRANGHSTAGILNRPEYLRTTGSVSDDRRPLCDASRVVLAHARAGAGWVPDDLLQAIRISNVIEGQNRTSVMTQTFFTVGCWTTSRADSTISR